MSSAKGVREVGWFDCAGGGQIVVDKGIAYVGHMASPYGTSIVDVRDPKNPKALAELKMPEGTHSHKVRVSNDIMVVNHEVMGEAAGRAGAAGSASMTSAIRRSRARSPAGKRPAPACIATTSTAAICTARRHSRAIVGNIVGDFRPEGSVAAGGGRPLVDAGAVDRRRRDADLGRHGAPLPPSAAHGQPALHQLLAGRLRHPRHRRHVEAEATSPGSTGVRRSRARPTARCRCRSRSTAASSWWSPTRTSSTCFRGRRPSSGSSTSPYEERPVPFATFQVDALDGTPQPKATGCHQPIEKITGTEIPAAWFAHGLRIIDIAVPRAPREVAYFVPDPAPGAEAALKQRRVRGRPRSDLPGRPRARISYPGTGLAEPSRRK